MSKNKIALITGITGQDGSYLAELLLEKGYTVHGIIRRSSIDNTSKIKHLLRKENLILLAVLPTYTRIFQREGLIKYMTFKY